MHNKNANCYNIEKNFKYSTVISTFSEHITIYRTLSIDIWQLKHKKQKMANFFSANFSELSNFSKFSSLFFWEKPLWNQKLLLLTATAWRSSYTLVRAFPLFSPPNIKTMFLKQSAVLFSSCQKKIFRILCVWTLKILFTNKRILT